MVSCSFNCKSQVGGLWHKYQKLQWSATACASGLWHILFIHLPTSNQISSIWKWKGNRCYSGDIDIAIEPIIYQDVWAKKPIGRLGTAVGFPEMWIFFQRKKGDLFPTINTLDLSMNPKSLRKFLSLEQSSGYFLMKFENGKTWGKKAGWFHFLPSLPNYPGTLVLWTQTGHSTMCVADVWHHVGTTQRFP